MDREMNDDFEGMEVVLGTRVRSLLDKKVEVSDCAGGVECEAIFLGIERDERGDYYCAVRYIDSVEVVGVHPSRIRVPWLCI